MTEVRFSLGPLRRAVIRRRKAKGWKRNHLADVSGVPNPYLTRFESGGTKTVGLETVVKLASALSVPLDVLLAEAELPTVRLESEELDGVYRMLDHGERRALVQNAHTLHELQAGYAAAEQDRNDPLSEKSESGLGHRTAAEQRSSYGTDSEPTHPANTMPEIEPTAANDGSDLKRAQRQREARREQAQRGD